MHQADSRNYIGSGCADLGVGVVALEQSQRFDLVLIKRVWRIAGVQRVIA